MTNYAAGHLAEKYAAEYLQKHGYKIIASNWKTRYCEIDIIAKYKKKVHFIEVKYRKTDAQGSGFEYITGRKLKQMKFAANMWVSENDWDKDYALGAIELTGPDFKVTNFLPVI
ncbi:MAG: YraN family protein [Minisyncoccia bacterium]